MARASVDIDEIEMSFGQVLAVLLLLKALVRASLLFALPYWIQRRDCRSVQACWRIDCRNSSNVTMVCDSTI